MIKEQKNEENTMVPQSIITNMANADSAKKFLDDLLFDAENCGHLEGTVDGLMLLFEALTEKSGAANLAEELQIHLYGWSSHHTDSYSVYLETVKAGKDYRETIRE